MNNDSMSETINNSSVGNPSSHKKTSGRLESIGYWIFLATVILAPLVFWANPYISQDLSKTFIIALGTIISIVLFGFVAIKERRLSLPPKSLVRMSLLVVISLIVSSILSIHFGKSFFGQGFEIGTASFIIILFIAGLTSFTIVSRQRERAVVLYVGIAVAYLIAFIYQFLRICYGSDFMTFGVFNTPMSSLVGSLTNFGSFSMIIVIVSLLALSLLKLSSKMKISYSVLLALATIGSLVAVDVRIWQVATLVFLGLSIFLSLQKWSVVRKNIAGGKIKTFLASMAWLPIIALVFSFIVVSYAPSIVKPIATKINVNGELILPWQMTVDVTASVIQNYPLFGVGPNHFAQAFLAYKPTVLNSTNVWSAEFSNGFGLFPTFIATQGLVGAILWILLFIFFGIFGAKVLKNLPGESDKRFMIVSSFAIATFLWITAIISVPSHAIIFYAFVLTGIFVGVATTSGSFASRVYAPTTESKMYKILPSILAIIVLVLVVWGLIYVKKTIALSYFAGGMKQLSVSGDTQAAFKAFTSASKLDSSDIYWQAKVEASLVEAQKLVSTITATSNASTTQEVLGKITVILNQGLTDAKKAVAFDPTNYYNYVSLARISEAATNIGMANAYEGTVTAYGSAINMNPFNPSLYLSLASFEARQKKYDDALRDLGKTLQVKNNYLDAVFLLSQVYAAKGDVANAITAAKVAVELNPQNSLLLFQLGILDYSNKDYVGAAQALASAIKIQPDYANAKYFLGLSKARLNDNPGAIEQFTDLAKTNPDNQEVTLILTNLQSGKPIFADAKAPVTTAPEKRASLPIKEKR